MACNLYMYLLVSAERRVSVVVVVVVGTMEG